MFRLLKCHFVRCNSTLSFHLQLKSQLPSLVTSTNSYDLENHSKDEGNHIHSPYTTSLVVFPTSTAEIETLVSLATDSSISLIAYGVGTSLEGHVLPQNETTVTVSLAKMNKVLDVSDLPSGFVTVQPGITRLELNEHLKATGYEFKIDPGANATIGGMTATNASGTRAVKYGTMRENVASLKVTTASSSGTLSLGARAKKSSAGFDLKHLFIGSEGTLGIISEIVVRVFPKCEAVVGGKISFNSVDDALDAVQQIMAVSANSVSKIEFLDSFSISAFNKYVKGRGDNDDDDLPILPHLFVEFEGVSYAAVEEAVGLAKEICSGVSVNFDFSTDETSMSNLWKARHNLYYANMNTRKGASACFTTDICVPIQHLSKIITLTREDIDKHEVTGCIVGHCGDGNFHALFPIVDDDGEIYKNKIRHINSRLIERALTVGGTCSGEHGIGVGKKAYLQAQYCESTMEAMKSIKALFDPNNTMNPNKIM